MKQLLAIFYDKRDGIRGTGTILKPLFFGFHADKTLPPYGSQVHEEQFLLGDFIMAAPVFYQGATSMSVYFPDCRWFDLRTNEELLRTEDSTTVSASLGELPPHFLKGGHILFKQNIDNVLSSSDLSNTFTLVAGLPFFTKQENKMISKAEGFILSAITYAEQYVFEKCTENDCLLRVNITYEFNSEDHTSTVTVDTKGSKSFDDSLAINMNEIYLLGVPQEILDSSTDISCINCASDKPVSFEKNNGSIRLVVSDYDLKNEIDYVFKLF